MHASQCSGPAWKTKASPESALIGIKNVEHCVWVVARAESHQCGGLSFGNPTFLQKIGVPQGVEVYWPPFGIRVEEAKANAGLHLRGMKVEFSQVAKSSSKHCPFSSSRTSIRHERVSVSRCFISSSATSRACSQADSSSGNSVPSGSGISRLAVLRLKK